jgi:plasmid stabilization system protein ParE
VKVRFSDAALNDLRRIGDYIAQDTPLRARDFVRALRERAAQVADNPLAFPLVPHHERSGIRCRVFRGCLIFYRAETDTVSIVRMLHGAQDYEAVLFADE